MPIIKSESAPTSLRPFSMTDVEAYARKMLHRANEQAEKLLAAAQAEAEALRTAARAEGLAEGKREGLAQGKIEGVAVGTTQAYEEKTAALHERLEALTAVVAAIDVGHQLIVGRAEEEVLPLALAIARKITRRQGEFDPAVAEANLREAVRLATAKHELRIFIHPSQIELAQDVAERLKEQWPQMRHLTLTGDETLAPGGCRVLTAGGEIDADLDRQLDRIAADLVPEPAAGTTVGADKHLAA